VTSRYSDRALALVAGSPVVEMLGGIHDPLNAREGRVLAEDWFGGPGRFSDDEARFVRASGIRVFALGELHPGREAMLEFMRSWNSFLASNPRHLERIDSAAKLRGVDHVDHLARLIGIEHVGIGSDQNLVTEDAMPLEERRRRLENAPAEYYVHTDDEWRIGVEELDHPQRTFDVAEGLLRRGYSDTDAALVLGGNFVRVLCSIFGET
jgi:microsomal dipeptidase-like Zn-dependent dipeptidase